MDPADVSVCAVVCDRDVVAEQRRPPEFVEIADRGAIGLGVARAAATGATWLWLLDRSVTAPPTALEALLAPMAAAHALGDPILFSSMVLSPDGELAAAAAPWPRLFWKENAIVGAEHRLVALRAARYGSLLVHRRALDMHGGPRRDFAGAGDDLEWTARLLRETPGYLVPAGAVVREHDGGLDGAAFTRNRMRMLRGDGWVGQEKLWFAFLLMRDVFREASARPARTPRLLRALGAGLRAST